VARIVSSFMPNNKPRTVARWEQLVDGADSDRAAQTQLLYQIAVQVRSLKVLLVWLLLIIPVVVGVILAVLAPDTTSFPTNF
jgi:hypothetical protein